MPGLLVEKCTSKAIVLVGRDVYSVHDDLLQGFLTFIGLYYVLDVDYPNDHSLAFSIAHRYIFSDNRVCVGMQKAFDDVWLDVSRYLYSSH